jgi:hypothetical protein
MSFPPGFLDALRRSRRNMGLFDPDPARLGSGCELYVAANPVWAR